MNPGSEQSFTPTPPVSSIEPFDIRTSDLPVNLDLRKALRFVEPLIAPLPFEMGFVFSKAGRLIVRGIGKTPEMGQSAQLQFEPKELLKVPGRYLTHNHPNGSYFSPRDLLFAHEYGLMEIRVVSSDQVHILLRPPAGWNYDACETFLNAGTKLLNERYPDHLFNSQAYNQEVAQLVIDTIELLEIPFRQEGI